MPRSKTWKEKVEPTESGGIDVNVTIAEERVRVTYSKSITWIGLGWEDAIKIAWFMIDCANVLKEKESK